MKVERVREAVAGPIGPEYFNRKAAAGWRLSAVEWEREVEAEPEPALPTEEVPFGLKVSEDLLHLEENPAEREVLILAMELIIADNSLSQVARELNTRGHRTREGAQWGPVAVFNLLPRLVEIGPRIFSSEEWAARRRRLFQAV